MFGRIAKWVCEIDDPARIPELISRAFHTATSGRPGPVVIALPEDVLIEPADCADAARYRVRSRPHPAAADMARLRVLLAAAKRPFVVLGGGGWNAEACADIQAFAENVRAAGRRVVPPPGLLRQHAIRCYAGHVGISVAPPLSDRVRDADLLLLVGTRLGEASSRSYTLIGIPEPKQTLVHVHPGAEELGLVYAPDLPILAGMRAFAAAARALEPGRHRAPGASRPGCAHEQYLASLEPPPTPGDAAARRGHASGCASTCRDDAIVTNGAGNYCVWVNGFYQYRGYRTQLGPTSGSMGYGTPAAVAAKLVHPERTVVCFAGDGCFLMTGQELATAAQYDLPVIWCVVNNGMYGTIRMHQERDYPGAGDRHRPARTRTSRRSRAPTAATARWSSAPPISPAAFRRAEAAGTLRAARAADRPRGAHAARLAARRSATARSAGARSRAQAGRCQATSGAPGVAAVSSPATRIARTGWPAPRARCTPSPSKPTLTRLRTCRHTVSEMQSPPRLDEVAQKQATSTAWPDRSPRSAITSRWSSAGAQQDAPLRGQALVAPRHAALDLERAFHGVDHDLEGGQRALDLERDDAAAHAGDSPAIDPGP